MEITFVNQYSGDAPKRRRLAHACASCRSRKKRCVHFSTDSATNVSDHRDETSSERRETSESSGHSTKRSSGGRPIDRPNKPLANGTAEDTETHQPNASPTTPRIISNARFVSDLEPESALLNRPVPSSDSSQKLPNEDIGVWVDRAEWDALVKQKNDLIVMNRGFRHSQRPHSAVLGPLIDIYFKKIHPIFPLLDEDEFRRNHVGGIVPEALVHAMCLAVAKDSDAEPYLKLSDSPETIAPRQFCSILHDSVKGAVRVPVRFEKLTLIRILALTSLHTEGSEGAEEASILLSQGIHYAQTLGIHLGQQGASVAGSELLLKRLFWCLWALDRSNAAMNGRPIIMSDNDIAMEPFASGESGFPAFEAWLKMSDLLNKIIDFYRPTKDFSVTGWEGPYPTLEEIIDDVDGWDLSASLLATIHLFYLTVGILAHRTRGVKELPCGLASHLRQRLFAIETGRLMGAPNAPTLHPLPLLPYSISLSLSVSYQFLRQSQLAHQQDDARQDFRTCCRILQQLRLKWSSADVMATLAKKVLDQLDRAPDLAAFRIRRSGKHGNIAENAADGAIPAPSACQYDADSAQQHDSPETQQLTQRIDGDPSSSHDPQQLAPDGVNLFDNMDDVFDTFMDPNYPLNFDMSFVGDLGPLDWNSGGFPNGS